ncbi:hypothetical protein D7Y23_29815 [Corallococcus sp. AB050B]|nr:hypothetical protein D7Y23_29815 [Corallococcus sp. AB050B]
MDVSEFLENFFGADNKFTLSKPEHLERVQPWVERLRTQPPQRTLLPHWRQDGEVEWYGLAFSDAELRILSEEITAFVGPSYSDFRGLPTVLDENRLLERAVRELTGGRAFRFRGRGGLDIQKTVAKGLNLLRLSWEQRKGRQREAPRPTSIILRDFYLALGARHRASAEAHLRFLQEHFRLDALNLLFLRVQLLAELGGPAELLAIQGLDDLLRVRRPLPVTWALITAIYQKDIAPLEATGNAAGAVALFTARILPAFGSLYEKRAGSLQPEVVKSFMLLAVARGRADLRDELLTLPLPVREQAFLAQLAALLPAAALVQAPHSLEAAHRAALLSDFDQAFALARKSEPSLARARLLFECAYELGNLEAEREAVGALESLPVGDREMFLRSRRNRDYYAALVGKEQGTPVSAGSAAVPVNWVDWLVRLRDDSGWDRAYETAKQGSTEWSPAALLSPDRTGELAGLIAQVGTQGRFQNALPHLLAFFLQHGDEAFPRPEFRPIYLRLLEALVYGTQGGADVARLFYELAEALLRVGLSLEMYAEMEGLAEDLWKSWVSPILLDGLLDFQDLLMAYPCQDTALRVRLLGCICGELGRFRGRLAPSQLQMLRRLSTELSMPELFRALAEDRSTTEAVEEAQEHAGLLANKMVAIYTLTESVGQRVRDMLLQTYTGVVVQLSHDKVGNERLKQLARNADLFVMVTASAKHAATLFIEDHRKERPLLRPAGKGSASALRVIHEHLKSSAAEQTV